MAFSRAQKKASKQLDWSAGRSGSFFCFSPDKRYGVHCVLAMPCCSIVCHPDSKFTKKRFILKTVPYQESKVLRDIAPMYFKVHLFRRLYLYCNFLSRTALSFCFWFISFNWKSASATLHRHAVASIFWLLWANYAHHPRCSCCGHG